MLMRTDDIVRKTPSITLYEKPSFAIRFQLKDFVNN